MCVLRPSWRQAVECVIAKHHEVPFHGTVVHEWGCTTYFIYIHTESILFAVSFREVTLKQTCVIDTQDLFSKMQPTAFLCKERGGEEPMQMWELDQGTETH